MSPPLTPFKNKLPCSYLLEFQLPMDKFDLLMSAPLLFYLVFQLVDLLLELLHWCIGGGPNLTCKLCNGLFRSAGLFKSALATPRCPTVPPLLSWAWLQRQINWQSGSATKRCLPADSEKCSEMGRRLSLCRLALQREAIANRLEL